MSESVEGGDGNAGIHEEQQKHITPSFRRTLNRD